MDGAGALYLGAPAGELVLRVLDALPEPVLVLDAQGRILAANAATQPVLDRPPEDVLGRPLPDLLAPIDGEALREAWPRLAAEGQPWQRLSSLHVLGARGTTVQVHVAPLDDPAGAARAVVTMRTPSAVPPAEPPGHLAAEFGDALQGDQLVLHYQPIVRLADRRPVALESLARWDHPQRGLLEPARFLALADSPALASRLGERVLRLACHAAAAWTSSWPAGQVAVNVSARQLVQPGLAALVREALTVASCPADRLLLEVPERALLQDPDASLAAVVALKDVGVGVAVDDLGTGSSSLSYFRRFPLDMVKIDRSLIAGLGSDPEAGAVVAALVSLAEAMRVRCVAEGVETADQLMLLRRLRCPLGQGHLFSRPLTLSAARQWVVRAFAPSPVPREVPVPVAAEVVQRALQLQAEGASLHTVAARLNSEGHRNTGGRRFHHTAVARLIADSKYPDVPM